MTVPLYYIGLEVKETKNSLWAKVERVQFRVKEIQKKSYIQWRYIPTEENPADVASRGYSPQNVPADL